ncbi:MerR family transcriptional regulator [Massilia sp. Root418]|uniref:MerR family transcriptional regulator n=1 Tax=Massilia sp. Root418 TaxID=1736532 RepID=UPI0006F46819|nr:MerR family transcriptional regulator [Massilia sp. Root418]KQW96790.1 MerR family transcriptional regulator [Massilia sp. Root418]
MIRVGELARRAGLTVRALHHYDSLGLLKPSARAESGYRLYNAADVARLHQIQALRRFGMPLARIAAFLAQPEPPLADLVARQIAALDRQIAQAAVLRGQLAQLQQQLAGGEQPGLADWLAALERMAGYEQYFSKEELAALPLAGSAAQREWAALVAAVHALMAQGAQADSEAAQTLARQWMSMLERGTAANPDFARRLNAMLADRPAARAHSGISPAMQHYVAQAFSAFKLTLYAEYLDEAELAHMRAHSGTQTDAWLTLIAAVQQQMAAGAAPHDSRTQELARQWLALFQRHAGADPATREKLRRAHEAHPILLSGTWITPALLAYLRTALAAPPAA